MLGKVYEHKKNLRTLEKCKLEIFKNKLIMRSKQETQRPLIFMNTETLEEEDYILTFDQDKSKPTFEFKNDKENNRFMQMTPIFTDSNYLYVLSMKKPDRGSFFLVF